MDRVALIRLEVERLLADDTAEGRQAGTRRYLQEIAPGIGDLGFFHSLSPGSEAGSVCLW